MKLFHLEKKLINRNPVGFFKHIHYVLLEGLTHIVPEHLLKVKCDTVTEGVAHLGKSLGVHDPIYISLSLVGNVGNMLARVIVTLTMSAGNEPMSPYCPHHDWI